MKITLKDITLIGLLVALIECCKAILLFLPNVELTSFLLIMFAIYFGPKIFIVVPVFTLIEGLLYGFGIWWIMYLYAWPILVLLALIFRKKEDPIFFAVLSGIFGLSFGALCSIPYIFIGANGKSLQAGLQMAFSWWIAGIPWDLIHGIANFVIMLLLYKPIKNVMKKGKELYFSN